MALDSLVTSTNLPTPEGALRPAMMVKSVGPVMNLVTGQNERHDELGPRQERVDQNFLHFSPADALERPRNGC